MIETPLGVEERAEAGRERLRRACEVEKRIRPHRHGRIEAHPAAEPRPSADRRADAARDKARRDLPVQFRLYGVGRPRRRLRQPRLQHGRRCAEPREKFSSPHRRLPRYAP